jgi:bifunctional non-homologous end joining protein LigD
VRASPPIGDGWQYEVKFDGYRLQHHKAGLSSAMYGKNGGDFTRRVPAIAAAVLGRPTRSCVIDGEAQQIALCARQQRLQSRAPLHEG